MATVGALLLAAAADDDPPQAAAVATLGVAYPALWIGWAGVGVASGSVVKEQQSLTDGQVAAAGRVAGYMADVGPLSPPASALSSAYPERLATMLSVCIGADAAAVNQLATVGDAWLRYVAGIATAGNPQLPSSLGPGAETLADELWTATAATVKGAAPGRGDWGLPSLGESLVDDLEGEASALAKTVAGALKAPLSLALVGAAAVVAYLALRRK